MSVEYVPGTSLAHRLDPRVKLGFFVVVMLVAGCWSDPIFLGGFFFLLALLCRASRIPGRVVTSLLKTLLPVLVAYFLFNLFFKPHPNPYVLFYVIPPGVFRYAAFVSLQAVVWSVGAVFRFLIILLTVRLILLVTPVRDVVLCLVKLGLPAEFGVALGIGFGYIPVLIDENRKIREALQSRAWEFEHRNPFRRMTALLRMLVPTLVNAMRRANAIAMAIEAKGFSHNVRGRTWLRELRFTGQDRWTFALLLAFSVAAVLIGSPGTGLATFHFTLGLIGGLMP